MALDAVADFAGVSRSHLHAVLACQRSATVDWLAKIAAALEKEPFELLRPGP